MRRIHSADACPAYARGIFQQSLLQFHTELIYRLRRSDGIVAGKTGKTEAIFVQAGGFDHAFYRKIMNRIQADEIGNGFFVFFLSRDEFPFG